MPPSLSRECPALSPPYVNWRPILEEALPVERPGSVALVTDLFALPLTTQVLDGAEWFGTPLGAPSAPVKSMQALEICSAET